MRRVACVIGAAIIGCLSGFHGLHAQVEFSHEEHAVFFSECSACHGGISSEDPAEAYPDPSLCAACHDGATAPSISWARPDQRASNLLFSHGPHEFGCAFCHQPGGAEDLANLVFPEPETCLSCHAPEAEAHLAATGSCQDCHVPVGLSRLSEFAATEFPAPETHLDPGFSESHGAAAASHAGDCAICHDRSSCLTCHGGAARLPQAVLDIPEPAQDGPEGVPVYRPGTAGFHPAGFERSHGSEAMAGQPDCSSCHSESSCVDCHDGVESSSFHPLNFMASHGPEAFGRVSDCRSCHTSEAFCRECHLNLGIQGGGEVVAPFHDGQAAWVLSHPQAARQDLESCVSCHRQTDCLRCHSARAGLGVSPHGPDFNPSRIADRNQAMCIICHPSGGG